MDSTWTTLGSLTYPKGSLVGRSVVVVSLALLATFFVRLYQVRTRFRADMSRHNIVSRQQANFGNSWQDMGYIRNRGAANIQIPQAILPHSFLLGHLRYMGEALSAYPKDL